MDLVKVTVSLSFGLILEAVEIITIGSRIVVPSFMLGVITGYALYEYTDLFEFK